MNNLTITGNLTADPELKLTQNGKQLCNFNIANNNGYGDYKETTFIRVTAWGKIAENCDKYLKKGSKVLISGRIKQNNWTDKEGNKRSSIEIIASEVEFLSTKVEQLNQQAKEANQILDDVWGDIPFKEGNNMNLGDNMNEFRKLSDVDYFALSRLNNSFLKTFDRSAHALCKKESKSMELGSMAHAFVLEPEMFNDRYISDLDIVQTLQDFKSPRSSKKYQEWKFEQTKHIIKDTDMLMINDINTNILNHLQSVNLLDAFNNSESEIAGLFNWLDLDFKVKFDKLNVKTNIIFDLKTCQDCTKFHWDFKKYRYDMQAYLYSKAYQIITGCDYVTFCIIAVETTAPYGVKVFDIDKRWFDNAEHDVLKIIEKYKQWDGSPALYPSKVELIEWRE